MYWHVCRQDISTAHKRNISLQDDDGLENHRNSDLLDSFSGFGDTSGIQDDFGFGADFDQQEGEHPFEQELKSGEDEQQLHGFGSQQDNDEVTTECDTSIAHTHTTYTHSQAYLRTHDIHMRTYSHTHDIHK